MGKADKGGGKPSRWSGVPRWARVCTVFGAVLMLLSGAVLVGAEALMARYEGAVGKADLFGDQARRCAKERKSDIKGPLNILLVGIDPRNPEMPPLADSVMVLHVPAELDRAYLFSMPRDLIVEIPRVQPGRSSTGGTDPRLNAAMSYGSRVPGGNPDAARGFELLATTVQHVTGITRFDAGAIINFAASSSSTPWAASTMHIERRASQPEHREPNGQPPAAARPQRRGLRRPAGGLQEGHLAPAGAGRRSTMSASGTRRRPPARRLRSAAPPAAVHQGHGRSGAQRERRDEPGQAGPGTARGRESLIFNGRGHGVVDFGLALSDIHSEDHPADQVAGWQRHPERRSTGARRSSPAEDDFFASLPRAAARRVPGGASRLQIKAEVVRGAGLATRVGGGSAAPSRISIIGRRIKETAWPSSFTSNSSPSRRRSGPARPRWSSPGPPRASSACCRVTRPCSASLPSPARCASSFPAASRSIYEVAGGFLSVTAEGVTVLAESATRSPPRRAAEPKRRWRSSRGSESASPSSSAHS